MKNFIKLIGGIVAIIGLILVAYSVINLPKANATAQQIGVCVSNGPQCGTNNGTKLVCPEGYQDVQNTCQKFIPPVYSCDLPSIKNDDGTTLVVSNYYNKNTGDDKHCHRINWDGKDGLSDNLQDIFESWYGSSRDYEKAYNNTLDENPDAILQDGTGITVTTNPQPQNCVAGDPRYDSCQQAGTCPTTCGQEASQVPDGKGGFISCDATPACTVDQCINLPGVQDTLPTGMQTNADHVCSCLDGYTQVSDGENGFTCQVNTPPSNPPSNNGGGSDGGSSNPGATQAPVCGDGSTVKLPANPFVIRKGDQATVNFFITEGNQANIYYKVLGQSDWQYSVIDVKPNGDNFVSYTIQGLDPNLGYVFGVQQVQGCGGGQLVTAVIIDGASYNPVLFKFSYWEWSK